MKKTIEKIINTVKSKKYIHYILIIIVGLLISIPLFWIQLRYTDDGSIHLLRLIGLDKAFENGNFPLVFPYFCNNWGYSMTAFYPPIVGYLPYVLGLISGAFHVGMKLFASLTLILSGIFMYNFINEVTKKKAIAFFAAIMYMVFPYRLEEVYNRFAIGEFTSFVFIPIVFQGLYNLLHGDKKRHYYIAIGATGLILSHTISTLYTALFCILYILYHLKDFFKKDVIKKCLINVVFILLLSAFFLIPMLEFKMSADYSIFDPRVMTTDKETVASRVIEPWQFVKNKVEKNPVCFLLGVPFIFTLLIGVLLYRKIDKKYKDFYVISVILGVLSLLMCTSLFPWIYMPQLLCTIQYPWRMLELACFFLTPVCAINIYYLVKLTNKKTLQNILYALIIIFITGFTIPELIVSEDIDTSLDAKREAEVMEDPTISHFEVNREYLPLNSLVKQFGYMKTREDTVYILSGKAQINDENKDALHLEFDISEATRGTELELPYIFYPGYDVTLEYNGNEAKLETYESDNGFVKIVIPEDIEKGKIIVDYTATILDKASYVLSGISLIAFIVYVILYRRKYKEIKN